jgi:hypothetical protein
VKDLAGNSWFFGTQIEDVAPAELKKRATELLRICLLGQGEQSLLSWSPRMSPIRVAGRLVVRALRRVDAYCVCSELAPGASSEGKHSSDEDLAVGPIPVADQIAGSLFPADMS